MEVGLVLGIIKVAIETFQDERRGRFANQRDKLEQEWNNEMAESDSTRSDLKLDQLMLKLDDLTRRIVEEHSKG